MFEWKVEEMVLLNQKGGLFLRNGNEKIYDCENIVSKEDKIAFVDSMQDGKLSYLLSLIEKFNVEKESMPKDSYGNIKTVSLKAWIKRNDTKYSSRMIDDWYHFGKYFILGVERYITTNYDEHTGLYDTYNDLVDEVFHRQLKECERLERSYFLEHDEYSILKKKFIERNYDTTFGVHIITSSNGEVYVAEDFDTKREITIDELKELLLKYDQLDALVEKLTKGTHIVY